MGDSRSRAVRGLVETSRRLVPRRVRYAIQRYLSLTDLKLSYRRASNPYTDVTHSDVNTGVSPYLFGIVHTPSQYHSHFVAACLEMGLPFRVLDLLGPDWLDVFDRAAPDVLLVWPDVTLSSWAATIKDRVETLHTTRSLPMVPSWPELWLYENKLRQTYWMQARGVPHPCTWVFTDIRRALEFGRACELPIVFKTSMGASASGVRIVRQRRSLLSLLREVFMRGFVPSGLDHSDRQWGSVLLQEYLPGVREWRMVRIGDAYFGHPKGQVGDFHSGSGAILWDVPSTRHMIFLHEVTERGGFRSMDVDVFETQDGRLLVNELQAVFGAGYAVHQLQVNGEPGRFLRRGGDFVFEPGEFARNACANARIQDFLDRHPEAERDGR